VLGIELPAALVDTWDARRPAARSLSRGHARYVARRTLAQPS